VGPDEVGRRVCNLAIRTDERSFELDVLMPFAFGPTTDQLAFVFSFLFADNALIF
jgi:hypothetical protein